MNDDQSAEFIASGFPAVTVGTGIEFAKATDSHAH
jgi:hypothetical protein